MPIFLSIKYNADIALGWTPGPSLVESRASALLIGRHKYKAALHSLVWVCVEIDIFCDKPRSFHQSLKKNCVIRYISDLDPIFS